MLQRIAHYTLRHKLLILLPVALLVSFLVYQGVTSWAIEGSSKLLINDDSVAYRDLVGVLEDFGASDFVVVAIRHRGGDLITEPAHYALVADLTKDFEKIKYVDHVVSFSSPRVPLPSVTRPPATAQDAQVLADTLRATPIYTGELISKDARTAGIIIVLTKELKGSSHTEQTVGTLKEILDGHSARAEYEMHLAGLQVLLKSVPEYVKNDGIFFMSCSLAVGTLFLWFFFGNAKVLLVCIVIVLTNALSIVGVLSLVLGPTRRPLNVITMSLPSLLITLCLAVVIHIVTTYYQQFRTSPSRTEALVRTFQEMFFPCLVTSITTAAGFCSIAVSAIEPVVEYGLFAAVGVLSAFALSIFLIPILFDLLRIKPDAPERRWLGMLVGRFLFAASRIQERHGVLIVVISVAILTLAAIGITRITVDSDISTYLDPKSDTVIAESFVREHLSGTSNLLIRVDESGTSGALRKAATLQALYDVERAIESDPALAGQVGDCVSLPDYIKARLRSIGIPTDIANIPDDKLADELAANRQKLREMGLINNGFTGLLVRISLKTVSTREVEQTIQAVKKHLDAASLPGLTYTVSGVPALYSEVAFSLTGEQQKSIAAAFLAICVVMTLVLRSIRLGIASMIPNLIPVAMTLGLMGWIGIALNTSTSMIAAVSLGVAVDDTIHFILRYRREMAAGATPDQATVNTILTTGRAIVTTSMVLICGMLVLTTSSMTVVVHFGILMATTMLSALIGDLFLLPVCLKRIDGRVAADHEIAECDVA